jgi:hypothetical protein
VSMAAIGGEAKRAFGFRRQSGPLPRDADKSE